MKPGNPFCSPVLGHLLGLLLLVLTLSGRSGAAIGWIPDTYPWVNVDRVFGAAVRTGRIVPVTPNPAWGMTPKDGGVYIMGSDMSGWAMR